MDFFMLNSSTVSVRTRLLVSSLLSSHVRSPPRLLRPHLLLSPFSLSSALSPSLLVSSSPPVLVSSSLVFSLFSSPSLPFLLVGVARMSSRCPRCDKTVYFAEKVSSLGKDWHKFCLKCERCNKTLNPGGHAEHDGRPFCHKPCYAAMFGPKGVNIGGAGSYVYEAPANDSAVTTETESKQDEEKKTKERGPVKAASFSSFSGPNVCPRCNKTVYFAEKVSSLGRNWHRPCLTCERCGKTLTPGGHAEHDERPYCHKPCYALMFGPRGVNTGGVESYIYNDPQTGPGLNQD
ncbi:cysteine-rich protein 2-like [Boleophthalmus pectinirostris]|uniref:cysteine-rich protein 2-like n=1 Tax=Boleophthalmus pectinirostris TaxID=150288 RepID=UPI00242F3A33|nr:cysteine-rich protein 2-like [Boleophthalmus pectinirostris]